MKHAMAALAVVCVMAGAAAAAETVTGTWTMNVTGGPHGDATMGLTLEQKGEKVTGTFASGHTPDMALTGRFADGALKLETTDGPADSHVIFTAKLQADGSLAGYISSQMGDMKWTATRKAADTGKKDGK